MNRYSNERMRSVPPALRAVTAQRAVQAMSDILSNELVVAQASRRCARYDPI